jgi:predicted nucleic acid-binding protein
MARVALDSSILVYAELEPETDKGQRAADLITRAARDGVIPVQALGEFLRVVQRRAPAAFADAVRQAEIYRAVFLTPPTTDDVMAAAAELAAAHGLRMWDAVICAAAERGGARAVLTEDLQDGRILQGMRLINPFNAANDPAINALLT